MPKSGIVCIVQVLSSCFWLLGLLCREQQQEEGDANTALYGGCFDGVGDNDARLGLASRNDPSQNVKGCEAKCWFGSFSKLPSCSQERTSDRRHDLRVRAFGIRNAEVMRESGSLLIPNLEYGTNSDILEEVARSKLFGSGQPT